MRTVHAEWPSDDDDDDDENDEDDDDDDDDDDDGGGNGKVRFIPPCRWFMQGICQSQLEILNKAKLFAIK